MRVPDKSGESFFLDTNVLVYAYSAQDAVKREIARTLAEANGSTVSTQVLSELANVLTRRFLLPVREVRERILSIAGACEVIEVTSVIVLDALRIMDRYQFGYYDSQIIATALASGSTVLYTEDLQAEQIIDGSLTIRSPFRLRAEQKRPRYRTKKRAPRARTASNS